MLYNKEGILLSGGIDSMALAYWKQPQLAFTIDYGQVCADAEIRAATKVALDLGMEHHVIKVDCSELGSGLLSGAKPIDGAPVEEWWPYRNQLLVTLACMKGISLGLRKLYVGSIMTDGLHKDGTPEFYRLMSELVEYQEGGVKIEMPAAEMNAYQLVEVSKMPKEAILWSHSCHTSNMPCMKCSGCMKNYAVRHKFGLG
jgi:7-cyano-7-deazaguanine synthase